MTVLLVGMVLVGVLLIIAELRSLRRQPATETNTGRTTRGRFALIGGAFVLAGVGGLFAARNEPTEAQADVLWPIINKCDDDLAVEVVSSSGARSKFVVPSGGLGFVPLGNGDHVVVQSQVDRIAVTVPDSTDSALLEWTVSGLGCANLEPPFG
ncbi:hypothetical protein [Ilumatobacter fluminis]|uniref:hypothetical protein n=1 Tax=Ilumatobacter fluminis TaxID=467091 RepID=UPI00106212A8|nr:hypothetical protein [Ilumatobacter fluminis]